MNVEDLIREAYVRSGGKTEQMAREIAGRVAGGEHPGILVASSAESAERIINRVKEILAAHGFGPQTGFYEPVSGPRTPLVLSGEVHGWDESVDSLRALADFDRL